MSGLTNTRQSRFLSSKNFIIGEIFCLRNECNDLFFVTAVCIFFKGRTDHAQIAFYTLYKGFDQFCSAISYYDLILAEGDDGKNEKHKVNLLNASERYYIANEVVSRLEAINTNLFILAWQVRTLSWNDLWFSLDPEGWANVMSGKNIIGGIISDWNQGYSLKW